MGQEEGSFGALKHYFKLHGSWVRMNLDLKRNHSCFFVFVIRKIQTVHELRHIEFRNHFKAFTWFPIVWTEILILYQETLNVINLVDVNNLLLNDVLISL